MLPFILDIGKIAGRDIHLVTYFLAAFFSPFPGLFDCCPKRLKVVFWYRSFCHINSPNYILRFTFLFGYVYTVPTISLNNSLFVYNINLELFGWPYIIIIKATIGRMNRVWNISLAPKLLNSGVFLKDGYKNYAKMGVFQVL